MLETDRSNLFHPKLVAFSLPPRGDGLTNLSSIKENLKLASYTTKLTDVYDGNMVV